MHYDPKISYCFTAVVHHNKRDSFYAPKVLLTDIRFLDRTLFRDHTWVSIRRRLEPFIPRSNRYKSTIAFTAKIEAYISSKDGSTKYRIHELRHIRAVERSTDVVHRDFVSLQ